MKIKSLTLENIGVFNHLHLDFQQFKKLENKADIHILTGANGTGKTTILQAIASLFRRQDGNQLSKKWKNRADDHMNIQIELQNHEILQWSGAEYRQTTAVQQYDAAALFPQKPTYPLEFAVFAYSGYRYLNQHPINAIQNMTDNPLKDALLFAKDYTHRNLTINQWLANQISIHALKRLKVPKNDKKVPIVQQFAAIVSKMIGYPIEFVLETEPIQLYVLAHGELLDFDTLPDGLRSIISWLGDLLMRLGELEWKDNIPIFDRAIILLLDEIEVHLHPHWQRQILPIIQDLFKNAQIFLTTHAPFIANSIDGATIYELSVVHGRSQLTEVTQSKSSLSYELVLKSVFGVNTSYGFDTQVELDQFYELRNLLLKKQPVDEKVFLKLAQKLAGRSNEIAFLISAELRQLAKITQKSYNV
jgi:predicted ATP-binding protein involved in virulence